MNLKDISFLTKYDKYLYDKNGNKFLSGDIFIMRSALSGYIQPSYYIFEYVKYKSKFGYIYHSYTIQDHISNFFAVNLINPRYQYEKISMDDIKSITKQEKKFILKTQRGIKYRSGWNSLPELIYGESSTHLAYGNHVECLYKYPKIF